MSDQCEKNPRKFLWWTWLGNHEWLTKAQGRASLGHNPYAFPGERVCTRCLKKQYLNPRMIFDKKDDWWPAVDWPGPWSDEYKPERIYLDEEAQMTDHPKPIALEEWRGDPAKVAEKYGWDIDYARLWCRLQRDQEKMRERGVEMKAKDARIAELEQALRNIHDTDTTPEYEVRQPDRKGNLPSSGRYWLTPREIAENAMPELRVLLETKP